MEKPLERWVGKVAVVTGASSGIGAAIAEKLVVEGLQVVGLARRKEKMEALAEKLQHEQGQFHLVTTDMTNEDEILNAFTWIRNNFEPIHILVNSAGILTAGDANLIDGETSKWKAVFDTNVLGLSIATREAVKDMRKHQIDGHIIHINSTSGHQVPVVKNLSVYPASKFAVTALAETLRQELNSVGSKIRITSISPGAVKTELFQARGLNASATKELANGVKSQHPFLEAEDVANAVCYVLATPPHVQVHELAIKPIGEEQF